MACLRNLEAVEVVGLAVVVKNNSMGVGAEVELVGEVDN